VVERAGADAWRYWHFVRGSRLLDRDCKTGTALTRKRVLNLVKSIPPREKRVGGVVTVL
jgi:hypothetical protein